MLQCPRCQHQFELTFQRYFDGQSGRHVCPECRAVCMIQLPTWLKAVEYGVLIPGIVVCSVIGIFTSHWLVLPLVLGWIAVNIPMNVILDGRYGWLIAPGFADEGPPGPTGAPKGPYEPPPLPSSKPEQE